MPSLKTCQFKLQEDSGISSRKSDLSAIERPENLSSSTSTKECSASDLSHKDCSNCNISSDNTSYKHDLNSPLRSTSRFKRPDLYRGTKRKRNFMTRGDSLMEHEVNQSTGLTQEIDCMDIGSSTPKKRKSSDSPLKGVLKK